MDKNAPIPEPPTEPPTESPIEPPIEDGRDPIANIFEEDFRLNCVVGERPALSEYPAEAHVAVLGYMEAPLLPVEWDLSYADFDTAGVYSAIGYFTEAGLAEKHLSNPRNFTYSMIINVYENVSSDNLRGLLLEVDPKGRTLIRLVLPALSMDKVTAIYIDRSADGVEWTRQTWSGQPGNGVFQEEANFYSLVRTEGRSSAIPYRYLTDHQPIWLRVEIVGSELAGMSNSIYLETADLSPEEITADGDDGMGNRGGGGQNEGDREIPAVPENTGERTSPVSALENISGGGIGGGIPGRTQDGNLSGQATPIVTMGGFSNAACTWRLLRMRNRWNQNRNRNRTGNSRKTMQTMRQRRKLPQ